jgi:tyrosyl-tRNA synthetase
MTTYKSEFIRNVHERGYLHQCTDLDALDALCSTSVISAYIGFDCTASSLHAGSLLPIMMLRQLQQTGHKPIVLMGGGTTKVGDPSGKDESRRLLDDNAITENMAGIKEVFSKYLTFGDGPTDAVMVNNDDWLKEIQYIPFLRDVGRHFSINRMLSFDSVKLRLEREQNLSFLEFNYMILQAYDFYHLFHDTNCVLQMGGSDQWGNIVNGVELIRRVPAPGSTSSEGAGGNAFGLTTPLLTTSSGAKMGKTADGAVWLNEDMLSPYDYWQYWRNTEDADVGRFFRLFTDMSLDEIARIEQLQGAEINDAKKILADEITKLCHGQDAAQTARATAETTFEKGGTSQDLPTTDIERSRLDDGIPAFMLFREVGLAASGGEARRLIKGGGGKVNDKGLPSETHEITSVDLDADGIIKLSAGKKRHALVRAV